MQKSHNIVKEIFSANNSVKKLIDDINTLNKEFVILKKLSGSSKSFLLTYLYKNINSSICIILPDREAALYFFDDISNIDNSNNFLFFPSSYKNYNSKTSADSNNLVLRTNTLNTIVNSKEDTNYLVVTYAEAIIEPIVSVSQFKAQSILLTVGDSLSMDFFIDMLNEYNFEHSDFVYIPGQFAIRGSIIDVFPFNNEKPYRIDFFGDTVESIRNFNVETQVSEIQYPQIVIVPNINEKQDLTKEASILDFFDNNVNVFIDQAQLVISEIEKIETNFSNNTSNIEQANILGSEHIINQLTKFKIIELGQTSFFNTNNCFEFNISPQPSFNKQFDLLIENMLYNQQNHYRTFVFSNNPKQLDRLKDIFDDKKQNIHFTPIQSSINQGFIDHDSKICIYTDHQIFERYHKYASKSISRNDILSLRELTTLQPGDYVVHIDNGVGRFAGLQKINNNGKIQEVISIIYANNDILYVNIHSLHRISKYRDSDSTPPNIHRLGSGHWKRLKEKTKSNIKDIARDLILLYAKRREQKGYSFAPDNYLQIQLESSFIYEDTPDQAKTNDLIKADMESEAPMDRLVCGDVGFGKTELAIRAAFKAVCDSKQVAVLVPTTILALQHYQTFSERLKDFPVNISYISRLKTSKENTQAINELKSGKIDIIIGTHKLLNSKIQFKDLGLLIIDEEQKFGVAAKEKIKQLKTNIDTLTLTATPIPRTLQFSLMGARDLSIINTPPPNRQSISTEIYSFDNEVIKEAIYFEISRNGQVFFVNNRVQNIYEIEKIINKICPEAKTAVAHGQMEGNKLESIILNFIRGDFDVLVCTSIIENGVDIPNANTIIINNAHNFGLSDLHQMRGRVGRSNKKAFCYLLTPPINLLTQEAGRRLKAIVEFSDLGSGLNIALQDLDIRGAGNILGSEQSGFIMDLGFETYNKILNEALDELKEENIESTSIQTAENPQIAQHQHDCQIETDLNILIPDSYVSSTSERIKLYRELDEITNTEELNKFRLQLIDRFGVIPQETTKMFEIIQLRWIAQNLGFQKLSLKNNKLIAYFPIKQDSPYYASKKFAKIIEYIQNNPSNLSLKVINEKLSLSINEMYDITNISNILTNIFNYISYTS